MEVSMDKRSKASKLRNIHSKWRDENFINKEGFFPLFSDFKYYLNQISPGAASLFIYIGLHSNNQTGECYHNIKRIAKYFGKSPRTISSWFKELEDIGLVKRIQLQMNGVAHTFICPYHHQGRESFEKPKDKDR